MQPASNKTALRVQDILGAGYQVLEFEAGTRTAEDAANAIGCTVAQIAKSLIFKCKNSGKGVLVVASGTNRVDLAKVSALLDDKVVRADADFVRAQTGFAIGGVPPVGHATQMHILLDRDLQQYDEIWAAAGTPKAVFRLTPAQLAEITGAGWYDLFEEN